MKDGLNVRFEVYPVIYQSYYLDNLNFMKQSKEIVARKCCLSVNKEEKQQASGHWRAESSTNFDYYAFLLSSLKKSKMMRLVRLCQQLHRNQYTFCNFIVNSFLYWLITSARLLVPVWVCSFGFQLPRQLPPGQLTPGQFQPRTNTTKQLPPRTITPRQFPPWTVAPEQFPQTIPT